MVHEGQPQGREKTVWCFQVRLWSVAVISIALLSTCFIISCVVTYHFTYCKADKRLSELHTYHSSLTCFSEGPGVTVSWLITHSSTPSISFITSQFGCWNMAQDETALTLKCSPGTFVCGLLDPQGNNNWQWIDQTHYEENVRLWHESEPNFSAEECVSIVFWNSRGWGWNDDSKRNSIREMKKIYL